MIDKTTIHTSNITDTAFSKCVIPPTTITQPNGVIKQFVIDCDNRIFVRVMESSFGCWGIWINVDATNHEITTVKNYLATQKIQMMSNTNHSV